MPEFDAESVGQFALEMLGWVGVAILAYVLTRVVVRFLTRRSRGRVGDIVTKLIRWPLVLLLVSYGLLHSYERAFGGSDVTEILRRGHKALVVLVVAYVAWRVLYEVIIARLKPHVQESQSQADDIIVPLLSRIGPVFIVLIAMNSLAAVFGGSLATWLTGIGILALGLTFIFQEPLQGLFSGTYLALDNPFRQDDLIILDNNLYRIHSVGVRTTQLYDVNRHVLVWMPNAKLAGEKIVNVTKPSVELRNVVTVQLTKPREPRVAVAMLIEACNAHENILGDYNAKQAAMRRRLDAYRGELARVTALTPRMTSDELAMTQLSEKIARLDGALIRLHVEYMIRESGERFSLGLLRLEQWASQNEGYGFSKEERDTLVQRIELLLDEFAGLVEQISVWLYLLKIIDYPLVDSAYDASMIRFVERNVLADGDLSLQELVACEAPGAPTRPIVIRGELREIESSDIEADKVVDRTQFTDRADYMDYRRVYRTWHRNIVQVYRGLIRIEELAAERGEHEFRLDERLATVERIFADNFLTRVGRVQLPSANLADDSSGQYFNDWQVDSLKFQVDYFIDDVTREAFQRAGRVTTELLIEIDRARKAYEAYEASVNGAAAGGATVRTG